MRPPTVLLVDRDSDSLAIYSLYLRHHGYRVLTGRDGAEGLRLAREQLPDVVLAELFLPPVEGRHFTEKLKEDALTARLPVVAVTSFPLIPTERGKRLGVYDGYLTKPCVPTRILQEVERFVPRPVAATV